MGGEVSYERCPQSPTEMPKKPSSPKWKSWVTVCGLAVISVLFFTFLVLYVKERSECESRQYNHTFSAEDKMTGSDALRAQLAGANQSLVNTTDNWDSCKKELQHSRENISALEDAKEEALKHLEAVNQSLANTTKNWTSCEEELKHSRGNMSLLDGAVKAKEEAFKHLEDEKNRLQNQLSRLNNSLENCKQERNKKDKTIQRLKDQLNTRQTSSGVVLFPSFLIPSSLLFIVPGLCSLL